MKRLIGVIVIAWLALPAAGAGAQADDQNCPDFSSQAAAQAHLRADPSDPDRLDADHDGIACEQNAAPRDDVPVGAAAPATPTTTGATPFTSAPAAAPTTTVVVSAPPTTAPAQPAPLAHTGSSSSSLALVAGLLLLLGVRLKAMARFRPAPARWDVLGREPWWRKVVG